MIILLPPSESKNPPPKRGRTLDIETLSFPELNPTRERVLGALVTTSAGTDALPRLLVGERLATEVERNTHLMTMPTRPALETYAGPLYSALQPGSLSPRARRRARTQIVILSSLWGALRPHDRIPAYRLNICADLVGLEPLEPLWRPVLGPVLTTAAGGRHLVVDCRSSSYRAIGTPLGIGSRMVSVRVIRSDGRGADGHTGKRIRGELIRHLLEAGAGPATPEDLADVLAARWRVELAVGRKERPGTITVVAGS